MPRMNIVDRRRPSAYLSERQRFAAVPARTIVLSTGRGDSKVTAAEARELAAELVAAAGAAEARDGRPDQPTREGERDRD